VEPTKHPCVSISKIELVIADKSSNYWIGFFIELCADFSQVVNGWQVYVRNLDSYFMILLIRTEDVWILDLKSVFQYGYRSIAIFSDFSNQTANDL